VVNFSPAHSWITPQGARRPSGSWKERIPGRKQTKVVLACDAPISTNKSGSASARRHPALQPYQPSNAPPSGVAPLSRGQGARRSVRQRKREFSHGETILGCDIHMLSIGRAKPVASVRPNYGTALRPDVSLCAYAAVHCECDLGRRST